MRPSRILFMVLVLAACGGSSSPPDAGQSAAPPPGTTDSDCGLAHGACAAGQHCVGSGSAAERQYVCACTAASDASPDTCASNTDDRVVCDASTLACRAPRDFEICDGRTCDPAYVCARTPENYRDGGAVHECVRPCNATTDCTEVTTACFDGGLSLHGVPGGGCLVAYCGPDLLGADGGTVDAGRYFEPCGDDADSSGICVPSHIEGFAPHGRCFRGGTAGLGEHCSNQSDEGGFCSGGNICIFYTDSTAPTACHKPCDAALTATSGPGTCPRQERCDTFANDATTAPEPGDCQ